MLIQCKECKAVGSERRGKFKAASVPAQYGSIVALHCTNCGSFDLEKVIDPVTEPGPIEQPLDI